ncbi:hypothetical protein GNI_011370 [Gregarina niphandrodes]|uniref:Uncharacterized protein n=1 Tax=Gregarina niphandrodes TaxID=110365 RepID=A0A023BCP4_GRENI|nr:hypothetical protein GNI_011370 [Gregarina niphandrodes]EZG85830.1 hypothetical protein GNI_011370 [Gregarina niphandrodes]|eukprot:XP_011128807.1 hypothetical protein GNI_011370 [Gregarina niphandrodes]
MVEVHTLSQEGVCNMRVKDWCRVNLRCSLSSVSRWRLKGYNRVSLFQHERTLTASPHWRLRATGYVTPRGGSGATGIQWFEFEVMNPGLHEINVEHVYPWAARHISQTQSYKVQATI